MLLLGFICVFCAILTVQGLPVGRQDNDQAAAVAALQHGSNTFSQLSDSMLFLMVPVHKRKPAAGRLSDFMDTMDSIDTDI